MKPSKAYYTVRRGTPDEANPQLEKERANGEASREIFEGIY